MSLLVGLTGGIGSGKSLAASFFKELGAHIIDADQICRDLVKPGQDALKEIIECFGESILDSSGKLDREKLGEIIFQDSAKKALLESILHPKVFDAEQKEYFRIRGIDSCAIVIIDAALLIESGNYKNVDKIIVMQSSEESQISRIVSRNAMSYEDAVSRIKNQMSFEEKSKYADYLIENNLEPEDLNIKVQDLYLQLQELSKKQRNQ